jgi:hypothetical protein
VRDKIGAFQEWKEKKEKNTADKDYKDKGFDNREDNKGVEGIKGAAKEVDEGFEDKMSKETK